MPNGETQETPRARLNRIFRRVGVNLDEITKGGGGNFVENLQKRTQLAAKRQPQPITAEQLSDWARNFFLPNIMSQVSPAASAATNALNQGAARSGLLNTPFYLTALAGQQARTGRSAVSEAFERALELGQMQASVRGAGQAILGNRQSTTAQDLFDTSRNALGTFSTFKALQGPQTSGAPYAFPYMQGPQGGFQIPNPQQYLPGVR